MRAEISVPSGTKLVMFVRLSLSPLPVFDPLSVATASGALRTGAPAPNEYDGESLSSAQESTSCAPLGVPISGSEPTSASSTHPAVRPRLRMGLF